MPSSLSPGCPESDKTTDFVKDCCNETFTNITIFEVHKMMFHGRLDAGGRGGSGGSGGGSGGKNGKRKGEANGHAPTINAPPVTTRLETSFSEDGSDDSNSDDYDSEDDDHASEDDYISTMTYLTMMSKKPLSKCKKYRSEMNAAQQARFPYSCHYCKESFAVKPEYLLHMVVIHSECGACNHNGQPDQKTGELWDHDHFKSSPRCVYSTEGKLGCGVGGVGEIKKANKDMAHSNCFSCAKCGFNPGSALALNLHYATAHTKCRSCKIQFDTEEYLHRHFLSSKVHKGKYCQGCKMVFSSKGGFSDHCDALHSPWTTAQARGFYTCDACTKVPRSFPTEDELDAHLQLEHFRCFPCNREFGEKKTLYGHLTASDKHKFCIRCDSDFVSFKCFRLHDCPGKNYLKSFFIDGSMDDRQNGRSNIKYKPRDPMKDDFWANMWEEKSGYRVKESIPAFEGSEKSQNPVSSPSQP